ncbi:MAG: hypothetical protein AAGI89_01355 [Pseudomonadota bacterium]
MTMLRAFLLAAAALLGSAQAAVIDFSEFVAGDLVNDIVVDGVTITVNSQAIKNNGTRNDRAMVFDTDNYTGNDHDLAGPFTDVRGGADIAPGNVLIISEDGDSSDPDDNHQGGWIEFVFDSPVSFESFAAFDINQLGAIELELFDSSGSLGTVSNQYAANPNQYELIEFVASDVTRALFTLTGSGAIGNITLASDAVQTPLPAAGLLFGAGLFIGLSLHRRRALER